MIKQYSKRADEVYVLISNPKKARETSTGKPITPQIAKKIFELYIKRSGLKNIKVEISPSPSPVTAAFDFASELKDVDVLFGASDKGGDYKRWSSAPKYFAVNNPSINVIDPKKAAVKALGDISASTVRAHLHELDTVRDLLPSELTDKDIKTIEGMLK